MCLFSSKPGSKSSPELQTCSFKASATPSKICDRMNDGIWAGQTHIPKQAIVNFGGKKYEFSRTLKTKKIWDRVWASWATAHTFRFQLLFFPTATNNLTGLPILINLKGIVNLNLNLRAQKFQNIFRLRDQMHASEQLCSLLSCLWFCFSH